MNWDRVLLAAAFGAMSLSSAARAEDVPGIRGEFIKSIDDVEQKVESLAEAMPARKFTWRPMKEVRSVSEVFMHIAGSNYIMPSYAGFKPSAEITPATEKSVTDKAKVIETLKASFAHLRTTIANTPDSDLDRRVQTTFGGEMTVREVFLRTVAHGHEHLGQSIAYARANHVVPPWTAAAEAKAKLSKLDKQNGDKKDVAKKDGAKDGEGK